MGAGPLIGVACPTGIPQPLAWPAPDRIEARARGRCVALLLESDGPGGAEQMLLNLATELRSRGHDVVPVGPEVGEGWLADQFRQRGFEPETFRLSGPFDARCALGLAEIFRRRGVDVAHSHEFAMAVFGTAATLMTGRRHVVTLHGGRYWAGHWRRRTALRWALRTSHRAVTVSAASRREVAGTLGIEPPDLEVVPNGVPPLEGIAGRARAELGLCDGEPLVLSVGNLYPVKGHDVLVRALALVAQRRPSLRWTAAIAGRGDEEGRLRRLAAEGGITARVRLLGFRSDVGDLLAASDVFVLPSRSEGLPLALLEAMHTGTAVVATRVGGVPEAVSAEHEALLVPPDDPEAMATALTRLLEDPGLRARLACRAQRRAVTCFSVAGMADAYETLYGWREPGRGAAS